MAGPWGADAERTKKYPMGNGDHSEAGLGQGGLPEDEQAFPEPPPLPRERAARTQAERIPPPPPLVTRPPAEPTSPVAAERSDSESRPEPAITGPPPIPSAVPPTVPPTVPPAVVQNKQPVGTATRGRVLLAFLLLVLIASAVYFLVDRRAEPSPEPSVRAAAAVPVTVSTNLIDGGQLLIDARPWGQLTALVDSSGTELALPDDRETPRVLDLAPGQYTVFVTHPQLAGESSTCTVEVTSAAGGVCRLDLLSLSAQGYWEEVGWWP